MTAVCKERAGGQGSTRRVVKRAGGVLAGLAVGGLALVVVGPAAVADTLAGAQPRFVALAAGLGGVALIAWGCSLWAVLRGLGIDVGVGRACGLFVGTVFLNSVTPFGQVGGDLPSGYLLARDRGVRTEAGVAAIMSVNTVNKIAGIGLGLVGVLVLGGIGSIQPGPAVAVWGGLAAGISLLAILVWQYRQHAVSGLATLLGPPVKTIADRLPRVSPAGRPAVRRRLEGYVNALERIGTARTATAVVLLGTAGQVAVSAVLWVVLGAFGLSVPAAAAVVAVPVAQVAGISPTPGGIGGVGVTLAVVLVAIAGIGSVEAGAAAVLYRGVTLWLPLLPGGAVVGAVLLGSAE